MKTSFISWLKKAKTFIKRIVWVKPLATPEQVKQFDDLLAKARAETEAYLQDKSIDHTYEHIKFIYLDVFTFYHRNAKLFITSDNYFESISAMQRVNCSYSASPAKKREIAFYFYEKLQKPLSLMILRQP